MHFYCIPILELKMIETLDNQISVVWMFRVEKQLVSRQLNKMEYTSLEQSTFIFAFCLHFKKKLGNIIFQCQMFFKKSNFYEKL
jgi:hypothetical protein